MALEPCVNESKVHKSFWADVVYTACYVIKPSIFLGYSSHIKAFRVYNKHYQHVEESIHVHFNESSPKRIGRLFLDDVSGALEEAYTKDVEPENINQESQEEEKEHQDLPRVWKTKKDLPINKVIGDISKGVSSPSLKTVKYLSLKYSLP
ncbi:hypothetical protein Lal_00000679 [Lupinus albus]|nr:hypothetical protein Lal_00000679 [Lupinus albus]